MRIFISHISDDSDLARKLATALDADFHGVVEPFVSSEPQNIEAGEDWLNRIHEAIQKAEVLLVLCSPASINRPWINFETGAGWYKGVPLIPICHKGLLPKDLPLPFLNRQGAILDTDGLRSVYSRIAHTLGWRRPPSLGERALMVLGASSAAGRRWRYSHLTRPQGTPAAAGDPKGYGFGLKQHVIYRGEDDHVHERFWDGQRWHRSDLTVASRAHVAIDGNPCGYVFRDSLHVVHRTKSGDLHELWWDLGASAWRHTELSRQCDSAPPAASDPAGYVHLGTQHVVYRDAEGHIHELWWNGQWYHTDLTKSAGAEPDAVGHPTGYTVGPKQHVLVTKSTGHLIELWWDGAWHCNDLTVASASPSAASEPAAYVHFSVQHVVYRSELGTLHELWWGNGVWQHTDLTDASGAPLAEGSPSAYVRDLSQRVVYRGRDRHVHEIWWDGAWHHTDLTIASREPEVGDIPYAAGDPSAYVSIGTQHVVYRSDGGQVHQLSWT